MPNNARVLFTNQNIENCFCFKSVEEFILFLKNNDNVIIEIKSEIDNIDVDKMKALYEFMQFYKLSLKNFKKALCDYNDSFLNSQSGELKEMAKEFVRMNGNGKFLRSFLAFLGYKCTGKNDDDYLPLVSALEIFQTSILIHDDIIDNAVKRRGIDTIPVSYEKAYEKSCVMNDTFNEKRHNFANSMGICIGDLGFYLTNELLISAYGDKTNFSKLFKYYNDVVIKTCKGEMLDVILPFKEEFFSVKGNLEENIMEIYKLKTAWYSVIGPYCLGMILGNSLDEEVREMENILLNVGVAFQIKDDLLGIYGDSKQTGKSSNSDITEYKQTLLYSYVMKTKYKEELLKYYGKKLESSELQMVKDIFDKSGAKEYAECKMEELFESSMMKLDNVDFISNENKNILKGFIVYLQNRTK